MRWLIIEEVNARDARLLLNQIKLQVDIIISQLTTYRFLRFRDAISRNKPTQVTRDSISGHMLITGMK